jgi:hypothetical protein
MRLLIELNHLPIQYRLFDEDRLIIEDNIDNLNYFISNFFDSIEDNILDNQLQKRLVKKSIELFDVKTIEIKEK